MFWLLLFFVLMTSWFTPWWVYLFAAFASGFKISSPAKAFFTAFFATALAWVMAAYFQDARGEGFISKRLSLMFGLPHPAFIFLVLATLSGVSAGLFALSGYYLSELNRQRQLVTKS